MQPEGIRLSFLPAADRAGAELLYRSLRGRRQIGQRQQGGLDIGFRGFQPINNNKSEERKQKD